MSTIAATIGRCRYEKASRASSFRARTWSTSPSRRAIINAVTSKYAHHIAAATAMPATAVTITPPSTPASAPTPMATIDSPSATMTISPCRSAKWPGTSRQPLVSMNSGPAMSKTSAAAHTARRASPCTNDPATRIAAPIPVLAARPMTEWRSPGSSGLATTNRTMWATRTAVYASANVVPRSPKASGTHSDVTSSAAIAAKSTSRTAPSSGSTTLVSHAYPTHDHHRSPSTTRPRPMPPHVGSSAIERGALRDGQHEHEVEEQLEVLTRSPPRSTTPRRVAIAGEAMTGHPVSQIENLLAANEAYAAARANVADPRPGRHLAVVTCMDARIDVFAALGLHLGEASVIRNAGGRVTEDVLRSLALATHVLGVDTVALMQHTNCGLAGVTDDELREITGSEIGFLSIKDHGAALREDVDRLAATPFLERVKVIAGLIYDVESGEVDHVVRWERTTG